jgi:hypothetical protein
MRIGLEFIMTVKRVVTGSRIATDKSIEAGCTDPAAVIPGHNRPFRHKVHYDQAHQSKTDFQQWPGLHDPR